MNQETEHLAAAFRIAVKTYRKTTEAENEAEEIMKLVPARAALFKDTLGDLAFPVPVGAVEEKALRLAFAEAAAEMHIHPLPVAIYASLASPPQMAQNFWDQAVKQNIIKVQP